MLPALTQSRSVDRGGLSSRTPKRVPYDSHGLAPDYPWKSPINPNGVAYCVLTKRTRIDPTRLVREVGADVDAGLDLDTTVIVGAGWEIRNSVGLEKRWAPFAEGRLDRRWLSRVGGTKAQ